MTIRETRVEDILRLEEIFSQARQTMREDGNVNQWPGAYPGEEAVLADMARGCSYVIEDEREIVGTFAFIPGVEPTYLKIYEGAWIREDEPYATIHRIAAAHGSHGIARACFDWAMEQCRTKDIAGLRIDTHKDNRIMRHCVEKAGFEYRGIIHLLNGDERLAYQIFA